MASEVNGTAASTSVTAIDISGTGSDPDKPLSTFARVKKSAYAMFHLVVNVPSRRLGRVPIWATLIGMVFVGSAALTLNHLLNWLIGDSQKTLTLIFGVITMVSLIVLIVVIHTQSIHHALFAASSKVRGGGGVDSYKSVRVQEADVVIPILKKTKKKKAPITVESDGDDDDDDDHKEPITEHKPHKTPDEPKIHPPPRLAPPPSPLITLTGNTDSAASTATTTTTTRQQQQQSSLFFSTAPIKRLV